MNPTSPADRDYSRNLAEYQDFWSERRRRTWTYASQTKLKRFRALMRAHGFLRADGWHIFDQGFGMGLMLFCFPANCAIAGLEISAAAVAGAAEEARRRGYKSVDLRVFQPDAPLPAEWRGQFELVISSHVLEHLADPAPVLAGLVGLLKPGGYLCILVPVNESPGEDLNHFQNFTSPEIREMVAARGLSIVHSEECDRLYHLLKPVAQARQRRDTLFLKLLSKSLNAVLAPIPYAALRFLDRVLGWFGLGNTQGIVLARKPLA